MGDAATSGIITLDGIPIFLYDEKDYRDNVSVMFQDFLRLQLSVSENIDPISEKSERKHANIRDASRKTGASSFIEVLPSKYSQQLGRSFKNGVGLSYGQWQLLALSRLIARRPQVALLDEPNSGLDSGSRERLCRIIHDFEGSILIISTHRDDLFREVDQVISVDSLSRAHAVS